MHHHQDHPYGSTPVTADKLIALPHLTSLTVILTKEGTPGAAAPVSLVLA